MTDAPSHRARKRRVIGEKAVSMMAGPEGQQGKPVKWSSGSMPGGTPALLGRLRPRSALLSGLLGDVTEKIPSARRTELALSQCSKCHHDDDHYRLQSIRFRFNKYI